jgi:aminopeptidase N
MMILPICKNNANYNYVYSYARNIGPRILEFFESYYNIDYPLPKQDMAAIPDFAAGLHI